MTLVVGGSAEERRVPDPAAIEASGPQGIGLRVEFTWRDDRYEHVVRVLGPDRGAGPVAGVRSLEGLPSDDWPPSPAFQQLLVEPRGPARHVALLVGMSGTSHWSASVEPVPGEAAFDFDVACRARQTPAKLCASYKELIERSPADDSADIGRPGRLVITAEPSAQLLRTADGWIIQAEIADRRGPCTFRWRYRIALQP